MATKKRWTVAPGLHQDVWVVFALGAAALAFSVWFIGWSQEGQALAKGLLAAYVALGGGGAAGFCAVTEDPARRRKRLARRPGLPYTKNHQGLL